MRYIIFADKRFFGIARRELRSISPKFKESAEHERFFIGNLPSGKGMTSKAEQQTFVEKAVPLLGSIGYRSGKYSNVISELEKEISKKETFKLEVLNLEAHSGENAKSIEVKIGQKLESKGFVANLDNPDNYYYVVFAGETAFIGRLKKGESQTYTLDLFRENKFEKGEKISRAEFKLKEAFEYFGLDKRKFKLALDIGAAPGGWTRYMESRGAKVVAIDSGALDYEKLNMKNIVHIPKRVQDVDTKSLKKFDFDILLLDMNIDPTDSAKIAVKFADILNKDAALILTIKLVTYGIEKHMKEVEKIISKKYKDILMKKLPHNRREITVFATKK